jgi:TolA-binding protein
MSELYADLKSVYDVEIAASMPGSMVSRLEARIRRQQLNISRIERDILRLKKQLKEEEGSQKVLETKETKETKEAEEPKTAQPKPEKQPSRSNPAAPCYRQTAPPVHPPGPTC